MRRLIVAQMVLLLQLWGAMLLWMQPVASEPGHSRHMLDGGLVIVPIVISAMLLLIPAWLAARVVLQPWRKLSEEIAARGPSDLAPLSFGPRQQELRPLVHSVNALLERVREGAQRERRFIADAAHELRTPLSAMRVNVEALQRRVMDPGASELLDGMVQSGDRAARLVGQLLQLMRTDAVEDTRAWRPVRLDNLVAECLATLSSLPRPRNIELRLDATHPVMVTGDMESLASMIDNVVENAIKYSPSNGTVLVCVKSKEEQAVLTVIDEGPGIAPALHSRVFDRFYRSPGQTQSGSGLGLAIVKAAAEQHRGTVSLATGASGRGLRVTVALPLMFDDTLAGPASHSTSPSST